MFPVALRRERAAAETADRGVEHGRAGLERGERVRVARVARVVEVAADGDAELGSSGDERAHLARRRDADRVGEDDRVGLGRGDALGELEHACGSTCPSNGQPKATLSVTVVRRPSVARATDDASGRRERLLDRGALVALVERLGDAEREAHLVEPGCDAGARSRAR